MGWNWAMFFCQTAVVAGMRMAGARARDHILDREGTQFVASCDVKHAMYVDNFAAVSGDSSAARELVAAARSVLQAHCLGCHEVPHAVGDCECTGLAFEDGGEVIHVVDRRLWRLRLALEHAQALPTIFGLELQSLLGQITWAALLRRESLCIPSGFSLLRPDSCAMGSGDPPAEYWSGCARCCPS